MNYPQHLSEKIRTEIAISYIGHELRKLFPNISQTEIDNLPCNNNLAMPRDFWNGVHGIGMGFKLHIGFIYLLTAENINWTFEAVDIGSLSFGVERDLTKMARTMNVNKIIEYLDQNPTDRQNYSVKFKNSWVEDTKREKDPIIICEKKSGLSIYEGNGRLEKMIMDKTLSTKAFLGRYTTKEKRPINYWIPTSVIMDYLLFVYRAIDENDLDLFAIQMQVLNNMLRDSQSGKIEFLGRALSAKMEYREPILNAYSK